MPAPELQLSNKEWRRGKEYPVRYACRSTLLSVHSTPVALMHALLMSTVELEPRSYL